MKVHHAGMFTPPPCRKYVSGSFTYFDTVDIEEFFVHELNDKVKKLGYSENVIMYYQFKKPYGDLDNGMHALIFGK